MLGRYSFTVFFLLLVLGVAYWSDRIEHHRGLNGAAVAAIQSAQIPTPERAPPELNSTSVASKAMRAPASEIRPLVIEPIDEPGGEAIGD